MKGVYRVPATGSRVLRSAPAAAGGVPTPAASAVTPR